MNHTLTPSRGARATLPWNQGPTATTTPCSQTALPRLGRAQCWQGRSQAHLHLSLSLDLLHLKCQLLLDTCHLLLALLCDRQLLGSVSVLWGDTGLAWCSKGDPHSFQTNSSSESKFQMPFSQHLKCWLPVGVDSRGVPCLVLRG